MKLGYAPERADKGLLFQVLDEQERSAENLIVRLRSDMDSRNLDKL